MEEMERSHNTFLQGAQQELKKEMAILQKKILIDTVSAEFQEHYRLLDFVSISFYLHKPVIQMDTFQCSFELIQP